MSPGFGRVRARCSSDAASPDEVDLAILDIAMPRLTGIQAAREISQREAAQEWVDRTRLWVNPDCGLKTRGEPETFAALRNLVAAARSLR